MKIRLKAEFADTFEKKGEVELPPNRKLVMYQPANPCGDIEVQMGTLEGLKMMATYRHNKDKWYVGICDPDTCIISKTTIFNSKTEAAQKVVSEGINVGIMPLQKLLVRCKGEKSPLQIMPQ